MRSISRAQTPASRLRRRRGRGRSDRRSSGRRSRPSWCPLSIATACRACRATRRPPAAGLSPTLMKDRAGKPGMPVIALQAQDRLHAASRVLARVDLAGHLVAKASAATYIAVHRPSLSLDRVRFVETSPGYPQLRIGREAPAVVPLPGPARRRRATSRASVIGCVLDPRESLRRLDPRRAAHRSQCR